MLEKNLRFYRLRKGLTKRALAEACGVTPMAITHYEAGDRVPGVAMLRSLARALDVRMSDLLRRYNSDLVFSHSEFRRASSLSGRTRDYIFSAVEEYVGRLFDAVEILGGEVLPEAFAVGREPIEGDPERDARTLRSVLGIALSGPVHDLVGLLENRGVLVMDLEIEDDGFGGLNGSVNGRPYVAYNRTMTPERTRSTIAHELAHLVFDWSGVGAGAERERLATTIAGAFLFPAADARRELGERRRRVTRDMEGVAREYGISMMLLAKRAEALGIIGEAAYAQFRQQAIAAGWREGEPVRIRPEEPTLLRQLVYRAVAEGQIGPERGAELLRADDPERIGWECAPIA